MVVSLIFTLLALGCFVLAAAGVKVPRVELTSAGLACLVISALIGRGF